MRDFESKRQSDSESLAEFKQVLRTLHREAWPDQTEEQRDPVLNALKRESPQLDSDNIYVFTTETSTFVRPQRRLGSLQRQWVRHRAFHE